MSKKNGQPPESQFYDKLKGERVCVTLKVTVGETDTGSGYHEPVVYEGKLAWVDVYSIGVLVVSKDEPPKEKLIMKGALATVEAA